MDERTAKANLFDVFHTVYFVLSLAQRKTSSTSLYVGFPQIFSFLFCFYIIHFFYFFLPLAGFFSEPWRGANRGQFVTVGNWRVRRRKCKSSNNEDATSCVANIAHKCTLGATSRLARLYPLPHHHYHHHYSLHSVKSTWSRSFPPFLPLSEDPSTIIKL